MENLKVTINHFGDHVFQLVPADDNNYRMLVDPPFVEEEEIVPKTEVDGYLSWGYWKQV